MGEKPPPKRLPTTFCIKFVRLQERLRNALHESRSIAMRDVLTSCWKSGAKIALGKRDYSANPYCRTSRSCGGGEVRIKTRAVIAADLSSNKANCHLEQREGSRLLMMPAKT